MENKPAPRLGHIQKSPPFPAVVIDLKPGEDGPQGFYYRG